MKQTIAINKFLLFHLMLHIFTNYLESATKYPKSKIQQINSFRLIYRHSIDLHKCIGSGIASKANFTSVIKVRFEACF